MTKKKLIALAATAALLFGGAAVAHDEGHGPKVTDTGAYGGIISAVVDWKDADKGAHAPLVYKAELVRSEDLTVRLYLYDSSMKPLPLADFDKKAEAVFILPKTGASQNFDLALEGNAFVGKMPRTSKRPYNIDVKLKANDRQLLTAFDNLD